MEQSSTKQKGRTKTLEEHKVQRIINKCNKEHRFKDEEYQENLQKIAEDRNKIVGAIMTFEEHLNADNFDKSLTFEGIKDENEQAKKRNIDNFLNPDVIHRFKNENFLNSLYLTHMKSKSLWKPDKFKLADRVVNNIKMTTK